MKFMFRLLYPILIYGFVNDLALFLFEDLGKLACSCIGAAVSIPVLWMGYKRSQKESAGHFSVSGSVAAAAAGAAACILFNDLVRRSGIIHMSSNLEKVRTELYGPSVFLQMAAMGVVIPLAEELVFRGLIYGILRETYSFKVSALVSALMFALYHGNVPQGVYGFLMGLLLAWSMELGAAVSAPFLMHAAANVTSVAVTWFFSLPENAGSGAAAAEIPFPAVIASGGILCLIVWKMDKKAKIT